jgi:hypothetical protein
MLDVALTFLVKEVNSFLLTRTGSSFGEVELGRLVDDSGKWAVKEDHLGLATINIEEERTLKSHLPEFTQVNGRHVVLAPQLRLNVHVMVVANFKHYDQALRYLSFVLTYFQSHQVFTPAQYPGLDPRLEKLAPELQSLTYEQLNQVWAFVGGKQLPAAIYKIRLVSLQDQEQATVARPLSEVETTIHG